VPRNASTEMGLTGAPDSARGGRVRALLVAALVSVVCALAWSPPAQAGVLVSSATSCDDQTFEQPFLRWADVANYVLAPGGTLEQGANRWALTGGASVVSGNEPFFVHGAGESSALSLPAGSTATTAAMCVGIEHPTLRLFGRNDGAALATLDVDVLFEDATGAVRSLPIGHVAAGTQWQPTVAMPIVANLLPLLPGEHTAVAFRFTASGPGGNWRIDDVYVDPYRSR
jgi:hypothetical protein